MVHFSLHFAVEQLQIPARCWLWSPQKFESTNELVACKGVVWLLAVFGVGGDVFHDSLDAEVVKQTSRFPGTRPRLALRCSVRLRVTPARSDVWFREECSCLTDHTGSVCACFWFGLFGLAMSRIDFTALQALRQSRSYHSTCLEELLGRTRGISGPGRLGLPLPGRSAWRILLTLLAPWTR